MTMRTKSGYERLNGAIEEGARSFEEVVERGAARFEAAAERTADAATREWGRHGALRWAQHVVGVGAGVAALRAGVRLVDEGHRFAGACLAVLGAASMAHGALGIGHELRRH